MNSEPERPVVWNGRRIEVTAQGVPRYAFMTASINVFIDGEAILQTGGVPQPVGTQSASFHHDGHAHTLEASWGKVARRSFPVRLSIDGQPVFEAPVRVSNGWLSYWPSLALFVFFLWHFAK